jgi:hypothetical protein
MMPVGVWAKTAIPVKTNASTGKIDMEVALRMAKSSLAFDRRPTAGFEAPFIISSALQLVKRVT